MLFDCTIRSVCAMERYRRGELAGPRSPAGKDLQSTNVVRAHVLISMAMMLVVVRSRIGPFVARVLTQPIAPKLILCSCLVLPSVMFFVPFTVVVALYTMTGLPCRLVPTSKICSINLGIPNKLGPCYTYAHKGNAIFCKPVGKDVGITASYCHSVNAIETRYVAAD